MNALLAVTALHTAALGAFPKRDAATASFPHYPNREVYTLSGEWAFTFVNYTDFEANATSLPSSLPFSVKQTVPSAWDSRWGTGLEYSRGAGFYKAQLTIPAGKPAALHFQACSIYCRIFVDGKEIANSTAGGFTPFWADVPAAATAERTLVVMASNVFDAVLTPTQAAYYDFYQYGGIIREVTLHVLPAAGSWVHRVAVTPLADATTGKPSGEVDVTVALRCASTAQDQPVIIGLCWDNAEGCTATHPHSSHSHTSSTGTVSLPGLAVPKWQAWSPADPKLHLLTVFVTTSPAAAAPIDSIAVRFGLRIVKAAGRHITINAAPIKLHGFNRHDMYPQIGPSLTDTVYDADLKVLQHVRTPFPSSPVHGHSLCLFSVSVWP